MLTLNSQASTDENVLEVAERHFSDDILLENLKYKVAQMY